MRMPHFIQESDALLFQGNSIMDIEKNLENGNELRKVHDTHKKVDVLRCALIRRGQNHPRQISPHGFQWVLQRRL